MDGLQEKRRAHTCGFLGVVRNVKGNSILSGAFSKKILTSEQLRIFSIKVKKIERENQVDDDISGRKVTEQNSRSQAGWSTGKGRQVRALSSASHRDHTQAAIPLCFPSCKRKARTALSVPWGLGFQMSTLQGAQASKCKNVLLQGEGYRCK